MEGSDIREQKQLLLIWGAAAVLLSSLALTTGRDAAQSANLGDIQPMAVVRENWLNHLHRSFDETSMGRTGRLGPLSPAPEAEIEPQQIRRTLGVLEWNRNSAWIRFVPHELPGLDTSSKLGTLPVLAGFFVLALVGLGFGFTVYELKTLPVRSARRRRFV